MAVAASRNTLHRYSAEILKPTLTQTLSLRFNSTSTHSTHQDHTYTDPNSFIGSWTAPADPKVAQAKLTGLRRDYAKKVKELRLQYIHEVELQREDKRRKDEAKREAARRAQAEIKASKAAAAQARAAERKVFEEEFRQTLVRVSLFLLPSFYFYFFIYILCFPLLLIGSIWLLRMWRKMEESFGFFPPPHWFFFFTFLLFY